MSRARAKSLLVHYLSMSMGGPQSLEIDHVIEIEEIVDSIADAVKAEVIAEQKAEIGKAVHQAIEWALKAGPPDGDRPTFGPDGDRS